MNSTVNKHEMGRRGLFYKYSLFTPQLSVLIDKKFFMRKINIKILQKSPKFVKKKTKKTELIFFVRSCTSVFLLVPASLMFLLILI